MRDLSFVIVNWNTADLVKNCIDSIYRTVSDISYDITVVDNASTDNSVAMLEKCFPDVTMIKNRENLGFARANNQALCTLQARYAVLMNSDATLSEDAIQELLQFMDTRADAGIAGGQLMNEDGTKQNSFECLPTLATEVFGRSLLKRLFPSRYPSKLQEYHEPLEVDSVLGACMMVRKEVMEHTGLLDEGYFFFMEETDWCYRIQQHGWNIYHVPSAVIYHIQGQSAKKNISMARIEFYRSRYRFFKKHHGDVATIVLGTYMTVKVSVAMLIHLILCCVTLGSLKKSRERVKVYSRLFLWHCLGCPDWMGLQNKK